MLDQKVTRVADLRRRLERAKAVEAKLIAALALTPENLSLQTAKQVRVGIKGLLNEAEGELRTMAVDEYDGENVPHEAVHRVGIYKTFDYAETDALDHCREHLPQVVKLDKTAFEKLLRAGLELDFVIVGQEYRANIKSDLSPWKSEVPSGEEAPF